MEQFSSYKKIGGGKVLLGNNETCKVVGIGNVTLKLNGVTRTLHGVRHVLELRRNLISIGMLDKQGFVPRVEGGVIKITKGSIVFMRGKLENGLYLLAGNVQKGIVAIVTEETDSHANKRLGHMSEGGLKELNKQKLLGKNSVESLEFCELCILGKAKRSKFATIVHHSKGTLEYIHSDVWGPTRVPSHSGARYFLSMIDDLSRKVWIYILK